MGAQAEDQRARATIAARLFRLANGLAGDVAPIGQGISELRIHYGPGYRVYFQRRGDEIVILLCGGDKGTQSRDIEKGETTRRRMGRLKWWKGSTTTIRPKR